MNLLLQRQKYCFIFKPIVFLITICFSSSIICGPIQVHAQTTVLNLPVPGTMVMPTREFHPVIIKGITINPKDPLQFDFLVGTGEDNIQGQALQEESKRLIKYFLASLTVPEEEMWVNLSPYEKDRIIPESFGQTEMGRDLLSQDYMLKQLMSSLMYPENELGDEFWSRVYKKAYEKYGKTDIPMDTYNKVWIVPDKAVLYEHENSVFVLEKHLKVMLEEDYLAANAAKADSSLHIVDKKDQISDISHQPLDSTSEVIREVLIPELEKEVNEGKVFANLRQIYNSMILAAWFKNNLQKSLLGQVYVDKNKIRGVDVKDKEVKYKIYEQYLEAFKKGVFDYIREDYDPEKKEMIPRKYFSGGVTSFSFDNAMVVKAKDLTSRREREDNLAGVQGDFAMANIKVNLGAPKRIAESVNKAAGRFIGRVSRNVRAGILVGSLLTIGIMGAFLSD